MTREVVGSVKMVRLKPLKPNGWNANVMTPRQYEALCRGLKENGWLKSHALTVWGTNEKGEKMNLIIDGEHRHKGALAVGFEKGPALVLNGITEREARELNAKLDNKGKRDPDKLAALILSIRGEDDDDIAARIGISDAVFDRLMKPHIDPSTSKTPSQSKRVHTVKLAFADADHDEFKRLVTRFGKKWRVQTASDIILEALKQLENQGQ